MKKPEKNTTATMNTTPATMPTQAAMDPAPSRLSSCGGDPAARCSPATVLRSAPDIKGPVIAQS